jgi:hypothetical protein
MFREHRIVIVMEGGLIEEILCNCERPDILVVDDMKGGLGKDLMETPAGDMAYHRLFEPHVERGLVDAWFERWKKHESEARKKKEDGSHDDVGKGD